MNELRMTRHFHKSSSLREKSRRENRRVLRNHNLLRLDRVARDGILCRGETQETCTRALSGGRSIRTKPES